MRVSANTPWWWHSCGRLTHFKRHLEDLEAKDRLGVSLRVLQKLKSHALQLEVERGVVLSTADVCNEVIKPLTEQRQCSFADLLSEGGGEGFGSTEDVSMANRSANQACQLACHPTIQPASQPAGQPVLARVASRLISQQASQSRCGLFIVDFS